MSDVIAAILAAEFSENSGNVEMRHELSATNTPSAGDVVALKSDGTIQKLPSVIVASDNNPSTLLVRAKDQSTVFNVTTDIFSCLEGEMYSDGIIELANGYMLSFLSKGKELYLSVTDGSNLVNVQVPLATGLLGTDWQNRPHVYKLQNAVDRFVIIGANLSDSKEIYAKVFEANSSGVRLLLSRQLIVESTEIINLRVKQIDTNKLIITTWALTSGAYRAVAYSILNPSNPTPTESVSNTLLLATRTVSTGHMPIYMQKLTTTNMAVIIPSTNAVITDSGEMFRLSLSGTTLSSESLGTQISAGLFNNQSTRNYQTEFLSTTKFILFTPANSSTGTSTAVTITVAASSWSATTASAFTPLNNTSYDDGSKIIKLSEDATNIYFLGLRGISGTNQTVIEATGSTYNKSAATFSPNKNIPISTVNTSSGIRVNKIADNRVVIAQLHSYNVTNIKFNSVTARVFTINNSFAVVEEVTNTYRGIIHVNRPDPNIQPDANRINAIGSIQFKLGIISGKLAIMSYTLGYEGVTGSDSYLGNLAYSLTNINELVAMPAPGTLYGILQNNGSVCLKGIADVPGGIAPASKFKIEDFPKKVDIGIGLFPNKLLMKDFIIEGN